MTIILDEDNYHIERHIIDHGNVANVTTNNITFTLDRPGPIRDLKCMLSTSQIGAAQRAEVRRVAGEFRTADIDSVFTNMQSRVRNESGGAADMENFIILWVGN